MGSGKTTSFDIAHKAGVSQATVSRALRDSPLVNPKTRERIKRIARELNYRVDRSAAGLRSQQSHTIALLLYEDPTTDDSQINPFFLSFAGQSADKQVSAAEQIFEEEGVTQSNFVTQSCLNF